MEVIIMSGCSGAGKSTYIKSMSFVEVCSADHFFMQDDVYKFDPTKLGEAHGACLLKYIGLLQERTFRLEPKIIVVVDNTNISTEEIAPYYALADAHKIKVSIHTIICDPEVAFKRNAHNVPLRAIESMCDRLRNRKLPRYWIEKKVWPQGNSPLSGGGAR